MVIGTPTVLNLIPGGVMKIIHVNQVNENIEIQFRIMNGAQPFNVPEGVSCTIRGTKGDNFGYAANVDVTAGSNIVTVTLTEQLTAVAGAGNIFELVFVGASDDMKVSTENFILEVERAALGEDTVISDSDLAYADQVLNQLQSVGAVNAQVQQNKANIAAEITRATAAEQTLQSNINAEVAARQAADNTLQSNINAEASSRATTDASLQSQIDQLIAPSGSAPSAAEVENARIGSDGTVYPTLGDAIRTQNSLLKSAINNSVDVSTLGWEIGSLSDGSGTELESTTRIRSDYVPVTQGTTIKVTGNPNCLVVHCFDSHKRWISNTLWSSINNAFTVPANVAYVRILIRASISNPTITSDDVETQYERCTLLLVLSQETYSAPIAIDNLRERIDEVSEITIQEITKFLSSVPSWTSGGYKDASGYVQSNSSYSYSDLIPVSPGDIVRSAHMRFVTAYKTESTTSYSDFKTDVTEYVVSDVTNYIVISKANPYTSEPIYIEHTVKENNAFPKLSVLETVCNGTSGIRKTGNLSNGSIEFDAYAAIRKGKTYSFYGKITSFGKLTLGCGTNTVNSSNIEIDTTNVKFNNATATINTTAHGLVFDDYVYVIVDVDENAFPKVTIYTDGGMFQKTYADEWIGSAVRVHADADSNTTLTDCILTFSAADVKKDIWYCGDSYMAVRDSGKLPSKLKYFDVFKNLNSIGYSGAGSENVLPYVIALFSMDLSPKYLVWAIGMNNGDTDSGVNTTWKSGYDSLTGLADDGNFELILATIPNTPTVNNNYKNAIVRASGYRYVDFADAVQTAQGESTWISGMLSSDNVHPTSEGAKALASRLCADFPEIFN